MAAEGIGFLAKRVSAMSDPDKKSEALLMELATLRSRVDACEADRARLEEELIRQRARTREYADVAPVIIVALDEHGDIEFLNPKACESLGWREQTPLGKNWFDLCLPEHDRDRVREAFLRLMAGDAEEVEYFENPIVTRSGEERIIAWHNTLLTDESGKCVGTLSLGTDVTERRRVEAALRKAHHELERRVEDRTAAVTLANELLRAEIEQRKQTENQLRAIYDGMVDGILIANVATKRFVRANKAILRMLGYSRDELMSMSVLNIHPPDELPNVLKKFHILAAPGVHVAGSLPVLRKDGSVFYADLTGSMIRYDGEDCIIGFFRDISERRRSQEALQREHRVLRKLLESHDRERQLVAYEIHDGLAQQLAGAIMHFQATIHSGADSAAQLAEKCDTGLELLRQCLAEARRLMSGLRPPVLDESGIAAAVEELVDEANAKEGPAVELDCRIRFGRLEPLLENAVYRIIQECLTNAQRYSQSEKVRIELLDQEGRLRVSVTDWGIGFDPDAVGPRCFGLEGIRERCRLLGGEADIAAAPGKGTRVVVQLPLERAE